MITLTLRNGILRLERILTPPTIPAANDTDERLRLLALEG